ncbi:MAG: hypothetical protein H7A46_07495 [Verrucomicrobiales bacterium]|nr:hypothetical protein [Verrucomicrobiales bacterium]
MKAEALHGGEFQVGRFWSAAKSASLRRFSAGAGARIEDRGSRIEDRGSRIEDRGSRIEDRGSKIEALNTER